MILAALIKTFQNYIRFAIVQASGKEWSWEWQARDSLWQRYSTHGVTVRESVRNKVIFDFLSLGNRFRAYTAMRSYALQLFAAARFARQLSREALCRSLTAAA